MNPVLPHSNSLPFPKTPNIQSQNYKRIPSPPKKSTSFHEFPINLWLCWNFFSEITGLLLGVKKEWNTDELRIFGVLLQVPDVKSVVQFEVFSWTIDSPIYRLHKYIWALLFGPYVWALILGLTFWVVILGLTFWALLLSVRLGLIYGPPFWALLFFLI